VVAGAVVVVVVAAVVVVVVVDDGDAVVDVDDVVVAHGDGVAGREIRCYYSEIIELRHQKKQEGGGLAALFSDEQKTFEDQKCHFWQVRYRDCCNC
jgi:hypothetical protein